MFKWLLVVVDEVDRFELSIIHRWPLCNTKCSIRAKSRQIPWTTGVHFFVLLLRSSIFKNCRDLHCSLKLFHELCNSFKSAFVLVCIPIAHEYKIIMFTKFTQVRLCCRTYRHRLFSSTSSRTDGPLKSG